MLMNIYKSPKLRIAAIPMALTLGLGISCSSASPDRNQSATTGVLSDIRLIGAAKDGYTNAVNAGEQAQIYDPKTYKKIGKIASGQAFEIVCDRTKPNVFTVLAQNVVGDVNLTNDLVTQLSPQELNKIPGCP